MDQGRGLGVNLNQNKFGENYYICDKPGYWAKNYKKRAPHKKFKKKKHARAYLTKVEHFTYDISDLYLLCCGV